MGRILIRNVDDALLAALRRRAAEEGVSLEEETRRALAEAVGLGRNEALRRADDFRARVGPQPGPTSMEDLRRDRARDARG
ncbi:MAG: FitA-like ribbon-helix-helix domain-containing protein [Caulobacteraceae bacterium]